MDGYFPLEFPEEQPADEGWRPFIVLRTPDRIVTQRARIENHKYEWESLVDVYYVADPPTKKLPPEKAGLPAIPTRWEPLEGVKPVDTGPDGFKRVKQLMGDQGLVGVFVAGTAALRNEEEIYYYYDHPELHQQMAEERVEKALARYKRVMEMEVKPDFLCVGGSGTLVFQTVKIFRQLAFPAVKQIIELATEAGMPTHVHSCGPETQLVKIMATETSLTVIDPLEVPPMGDCNLRELKKSYGEQIVLKGNLHTTQVMLHGAPEDVFRASCTAIDDAAEDGGFILSTGDQCGRDTPFENLRAMVEAARSYGRY
jgi:uroporphyrinogen decarboxylase